MITNLNGSTNLMDKNQVVSCNQHIGSYELLCKDIKL
jgi:hypothetical protein